jgi:hypothetical protein
MPAEPSIPLMRGHLGLVKFFSCDMSAIATLLEACRRIAIDPVT